MGRASGPLPVDEDLAVRGPARLGEPRGAADEQFHPHALLHPVLAEVGVLRRERRLGIDADDLGVDRRPRRRVPVHPRAPAAPNAAPLAAPHARAPRAAWRARTRRIWRPGTKARRYTWARLTMVAIGVPAAMTSPGSAVRVAEGAGDGAEAGAAPRLPAGPRPASPAPAPRPPARPRCRPRLAGSVPAPRPPAMSGSPGW